MACGSPEYGGVCLSGNNRLQGAGGSGRLPPESEVAVTL